MPTRIDKHTHLTRRHHAPRHTTLHKFTDYGAAKSWVQNLSPDSMAMQRLRTALETHGSLSDTEVLDQAAWNLADGRLLVMHDGPLPLAGTQLLESLDVDPVIEALDLQDTAKRAAYELKAKHSFVVFTSGRRNLEDQARAMASNVVHKRKWIEKTYHSSIVSKACQKWVDDNPDAKTKEEIAAGLLSVFKSLSSAQVSQISKHLSGEAFDVQPIGKDGAVVKRTIRALKGMTKFLEKEGGLVRWHVQF